MNLKEAYHYQKFLNDLTDEAKILLYDPKFITTTMQNHKLNKATGNPDELKVIPKSTKYGEEVTPNAVIDLYVNILSEKEKLSKAIVTAKNSTEIDIDSSVSLNKKYHEFIDVLKTMLTVKSCDREISGTGYKINSVSGTQEQIYYLIDEVVTIDYDRNDVRKLIQKYTKLTDEISAKLDLIQLTTIVDYDPIYDITDSFEDIVVGGVI